MSRRMRFPYSVLMAVALALHVAAQSPIAPPSASAPSGTSRIIGRVMSSGSQTLGDALVTLFQFTDNAAASFRWTATTGADGAFDFQRLPAGRYRIFAERAGYSGIEVTATGMRMGRDFTLKDGEVANADLVLQSAGSISGRVTQSDGKPAAARVMAGIRVESLGNRMAGLRAPVTTDADGRYRIDDVPPGSFLVQAIPDARLPPGQRTSVTTLFPSMLESEPGETVRVAAGMATEGVDIRLRPSGPEYPVSGQIVDAQGRAPLSARFAYGDAGGGRAAAMTGVRADGRFTTGSFAAGTTVIVVATGETAAGAGVGLGTVQIGNGPAEMSPIVLQKPGTMVGRVVAQGAWPAGMTPRLQTRHEHFRFTSPAFDGNDTSVAIGSDGSFRVDGVIGRQVLLVQPLPPTWTIIAIRRRGAALPDRVVSVESGQVVDGVEVVVGPRMP